MSSISNSPSTRTTAAPAGPSFVARKERLLLAGILVFAAFLRFYRLGAPSIIEDEAYQTVVAASWAQTGSPLPPSGVPYLRALPLIALQGLSVRWLPLGLEAAVRLPVALFGLLNVWLAFLLGRRYGGSALGLLSALVLGVSTWCIDVSTQARMYEMLSSGSMLALLAYERLVERPTWPRLVALVLALWLAMLAHALGAFLVILPLAGIVLHAGRRKLVGQLVVAAAAQAAFWVFSGRILDRLFPTVDRSAFSPETEHLLAQPALTAQRILGKEAPWLWVIAVGALLGFLAWWTRRQRVSTAARAWALVTGLAGGLGLLVVAVSATLAHDVLSRARAGGADASRRDRRAVLVSLVASGVVWAGLIGVAGLVGGTLNPGALARMVKEALSYPHVFKGAIAPLLTSPHSIVALHVAAVTMAVFFVRARSLGAHFAGNRSWAARLLLLLGAALLLSAAESYYKAARYLYFLYGIGLICMLEILREVYRSSGRTARIAMAAIGIVLIGGVELPAALAQLPGSEGRPTRGAVAWLPDYGTREKLARSRTAQYRDYRAAGAWLRAHMTGEDLLLADAAHQIQTYVPTVHGHLAPPLREYERGAKHYFTGSALLRTATELEAYLGALPADRRVWLFLSGYNSYWTEALPPAFSGARVWSKGHLEVYETTVGELLRWSQATEARERAA